MTVLPPFSGWSGPKNARTVLVGEAWGQSELETRKPFAGESGKELFLMLGESAPELWPEEHSRLVALHRYGLAWVGQREAWLSEASVAMTNVLTLRPPGNKLEALCCVKDELPPGYDRPAIIRSPRSLYLRPEFLPEVDRLFAELAACRPNLVVALGNTACWALLRATAISSIRGSVLGTEEAPIAGVKVLPTYHPAHVLRQWSWRPIVVADLMKARLEANFPEIRRPTRRILINPTLEEIEAWTEETLTSPPPLLSIDTETSLGQIDTISFARSSADAISCQLGPHRQKVGQRFETIWPIRDGEKRASYFSFEEEVQVWKLFRRLLESDIPKLFQNGIYDLQYLLRMGLRPKNCREDPMLLHHSIFPEMQKGLGFLGSIYTNEASWKLMRRRQADSEKRDE